MSCWLIHYFQRDSDTRPWASAPGMSLERSMCNTFAAKGRSPAVESEGAGRPIHMFKTPGQLSDGFAFGTLTSAPDIARWQKVAEV